MRRKWLLGSLAALVAVTVAVVLLTTYDVAKSNDF